MILQAISSTVRMARMKTIEKNQELKSAVLEFQELHKSGCFVMPNPWDVGTAKVFYQLGLKALASTSAGLAFSRGLPDSVTALSRDDVLEHLRSLTKATPLPVNADFQDGYAREPEAVASNVQLCVSTGVAGLSIEDATGDDDAPLYERDLSIERIAAARKAIDETKSGVVLTARCEAWLVGDATPFKTAMDRLVAFAEAGADCLYAPGVQDAKEIKALVEAVAPLPLNVIVSGNAPDLTVERLAELGVRRISVGSALARVVWGSLLRAARSIQSTGSFDSMSDAASFAELNDLFTSDLDS